MTQFDLTDDQLQIQEMARKFTADAITPFAAEWDEKHIFPRDTIREAAELGFGAIYVSRGKRRNRPWPARGGADHGGDGLRLPVDQRLHLDPQHGELDDRPLRLCRGQAEVPAVDDHDGEDGQLLPDRAVIRLRRRGAQDQGGARRRPLCRVRLQGVHFRRRRERGLCDHGPHWRGWSEGHHRAGHRKGHAGRQLRRPGKEARLAFAADRAGQFRRSPRSCRQPRRRRGRGLPHRDDGPRRRASQHRRVLAWAAPSAASTKRSNIPRSASSSASRSPTSRRPSSRSPTWRPSCRRRAICSTSLPPRSPPMRPTRPSSRRWPSGLRPTAARRSSTARCSFTAATDICMDYPIERFWRDLRVHSILEGTNQVMRVIVSRDMLRQ